MKIALLCDPGAEGYALEEVKRLIEKESEMAAGYVTVNCSLEEAARLCYKSQLASRIIVFITAGTIGVAADILKEKKCILQFDYTPFLSAGKPFRVTCERHGEHEFQAREVEEELGTLLHGEKGFPVNLKQPAMELWCSIVDDHYVIGVDLVGRDLGKRDYKAFHTRRSLRATVAVAAVLASGFTGKEILVDPFCLDGSIPIEASLLATSVPVQKYKKEFSFMEMPLAADTDWEEFFTQEDARVIEKAKVTGFSPQIKTLKMARGNAKLAGVDKAFNLTKVEVTWLDTKFEKEEVDCIVTLPPCSGKNTPLKDVEKLQDDLFYQCRYVLKPTGKVLLITEKKAEFLNAATRHKFELESEQVVHMGGSKLLFLKFKKKK